MCFCRSQSKHVDTLVGAFTHTPHARIPRRCRFHAEVTSSMSMYRSHAQPPLVYYTLTDAAHPEARPHKHIHLRTNTRRLYRGVSGNGGDLRAADDAAGWHVGVVYNAGTPSQCPRYRVKEVVVVKQSARVSVTRQPFPDVWSRGLSAHGHRAPRVGGQWRV